MSKYDCPFHGEWNGGQECPTCRDNIQARHGLLEITAQLTTAGARIAELEARIASAPHDVDCDYVYLPSPSEADRDMPCNCWKAGAK
jgi:hypothetical protein